MQSPGQNEMWGPVFRNHEGFQDCDRGGLNPAWGPYKHGAHAPEASPDLWQGVD